VHLPSQRNCRYVLYRGRPFEQPSYGDESGDKFVGTLSAFLRERGADSVAVRQMPIDRQPQLPEAWFSSLQPTEHFADRMRWLNRKRFRQQSRIASELGSSSTLVPRPARICAALTAEGKRPSQTLVIA
jgi:hypothetical protein